MQNPDILEKMLISTGSIYNVLTKKRLYQVQGYERFVVGYLEKKFLKVLTQFDKRYKAFDLLDRRHVYRPDFYIPAKDLYIEVKSTWTLLDNYKAKDQSRRKAKMAHDCGKEVRLLLVLDKKRAVLLPKLWFTLPEVKLRAYIRSYTPIDIFSGADIWKETDEIINENLRNLSKTRISQVSGCT